MTETIHLSRPWPVDQGAPLPLDRVPYLVANAARAPSVHNTQPWRFRVTGHALEMLADRSRLLPVLDPAGRELLMSCGAALYSLRLAVRRLGYVPAVSVLPDPAQPGLLARVHLAATAPITPRELHTLAAVPHRHTHRGPFAAEPLPHGLIAALQHDAVAEGAALVMVSQPGPYQRLAALVAAACRWQQQSPAVRGEVTRWTRAPRSTARDGVPAHTYQALAQSRGPNRTPGRLPVRDFDLGRGEGTVPAGGAPPAATAVLVTSADTRADWLRAGQALQRLLLHAASAWVFAALSSQALESGPLRDMVRTGLALPGAPQMVLQLGRAHTAEATARRPVSQVLALP
jgi:nitroreductase